MKRRILALVCAVSLVIGSGGINSGSAGAAAADVSLSKTGFTLKVKKTKTIKVKKGSKVKINKQTFSSTNKKVASVTKKGKVTAKKAGKATIKVKVTYEKNNKKKPTKTLKCKVTVIGNNMTPTPKPTQKPTQAPTQKPTQEPTPGKPSEKNAEQVAALNKIITEQKEQGAEFPENPDDYSQWDENGNLTAIYWFGCSLKGSLSLSAFPKLVQLYCSDNQLTDLDVSKNIDLRELVCFSNQLKNLDISKNTDLTVLNCFGNQLTKLDVSKNTVLTFLYCQENKLTDLDVSKNTVLRELFCWNNSLASLNINTALESLDCSANNLTDLDVSKSEELIVLNCKENKLTSLDISNNKALTECLHDDGVAITNGEDNMAMVAPVKFKDNMDNDEWGGDDRNQTVLSFGISDAATLSKNFTYSYKFYIPKAALLKEGSCVTVNPWFDVSASEDEGGGYIGGISSRYSYDIYNFGNNSVSISVYDNQENREIDPLHFRDFFMMYKSGDFYVLTIKDAPARDVIEVDDGKEIAIDTTQKRNISMKIRVIGNSELSSIVYLDDLAVKGDGSVIWQTDFSSPESMSGHYYEYLVGEWNDENWVGSQPFVKLDTTLSQMPALNLALAAPVKFGDNNDDNWQDDEKSQTILSFDISGNDVRAFSKQYTYSYKLLIPKAALSIEGSSVMVDPWFDLQDENWEYIGNIGSRYQYQISNDNGSVSPIIRDQQEDDRELEKSEYEDFFTISESGDFYVLTIQDALVKDVINGDDGKPDVPIDTTRKGRLSMRIRVIGNSELSSNVYLDDLAVKGDGSVIWQTDFSNMSNHHYEYKVGEDIEENMVARPPLVNLDVILK